MPLNKSSKTVFLMTVKNLLRWIYYKLFSYSTIIEHLGWFQLFTIIYNTAVNISVYKSSSKWFTIFSVKIHRN